MPESSDDARDAATARGFDQLVLRTCGQSTEERIRALAAFRELIGNTGRSKRWQPGKPAFDISVVHNEIGAVYFAAGRLPDAVAAHGLALEAARARNNLPEAYKALHLLGLCAFEARDTVAAVGYFQRSLQYANYSSPVDAIVTMEWVARCWELNEDTAMKAAAIYEWICVLQPHRMTSRLQLYRCLHAGGATHIVQRAALSRATSDPLENACSIAANLALGNARVARRLARASITLAETEGQSAWRDAFANILPQL